MFSTCSKTLHYFMNLSPQHSLLIFDAVSFQQTSIQDKIRLIKGILLCKEDEIKEITNKISNYLNETKASINYFYMLLTYYMMIRPKNIKTYYLLIQEINQKFDNQKPFIQHLSSKCGNYSCKFISQQIKELFRVKDKIDDSLFYIYPDDNFKTTLMNDDIDELLNIVSATPEFYYNQKVQTDPQMDWVKPQSFQSLLSFCAFYGSIKCFKYFVNNNTDIVEENCLFAIAGGNFEIIHILEQKGQQFDTNSFEIAIKFHRNDIGDWLILNFDTFIIPLQLCLEYFNEEAFVYFLDNTDNLCNKTTDNSSSSTLCQACYNCSLECVSLLLERDANVSEGAYPPLYYSCHNGDFATAKLLIEHSADVNQTIDFMFHSIITNSLYKACSYGSFDLVNLLIENKADVNKESKFSSYSSSPLYLACFNSHYDIVKLLLENGADVNKGKIEKGELFTPLYLAASVGSIELTKLLLDYGADPNLGSKTPLCIAVLLHHTKIVKILLEHKADPNKGKETALCVACSKRFADLVTLLMKNGADVNAGSPTPLNIVCTNNDMKIFQLLLDNKAEINFGEEPPFYTAFTKKNLEIASILLQNGADINKEYKSKTALSYLCEHNGDESQVNYLIDHGANLNIGKITPLGYAVQSNNKVLIDLLLKRGADVNAGFISALAEACSIGNVELCHFLLAHGAAVNICDDSNSPLSKACENGNEDVVRLIIQHGASLVNASNALCNLCYHRSNHLIRLLIESGVDVNSKAVGFIERTPLSEACTVGRIDIIHLLLEYKVDINQEVNLGHGNVQTPLFIATLKGYIQIIKLLLENGADANKECLLCGEKYSPITYTQKCRQLAILRILQRRC